MGYKVNKLKQSFALIVGTFVVINLLVHASKMTVQEIILNVALFLLVLSRK